MRLFHGFMPGGSGLDAAPGYLYGKSNQRAGKISAQEVSGYPKGTSDGGSSPGSDSAAWKLSDGGSRNLSGRSGASRAGIFAGNAVVLAGACGEGTIYREHAGEKKAGRTGSARRQERGGKNCRKGYAESGRSGSCKGCD